MILHGYNTIPLENVMERHHSEFDDDVNWTTQKAQNKLNEIGQDAESFEEYTLVMRQYSKKVDKLSDPTILEIMELEEARAQKILDESNHRK